MNIQHNSFATRLLLPFKKSSLDDEASLSSTISVDCKKTENVFNSTSTRPRRVRFNEKHNVEHHNTAIFAEDCAELWYQSHEYRQFKNNAMYMAKEITRSEQTNRAPFSYGRVVLRAYEACLDAPHETNASVLTPNERHHLHRWAEVATSRLGLERWSVREIGRDKSRRRRDIVDIILDIQDFYSNLTLEQREQKICSTSQTISRPSRLFARTIAESQAAVLDKECYSASC